MVSARVREGEFFVAGLEGNIWILIKRSTCARPNLLFFYLIGFAFVGRQNGRRVFHRFPGMVTGRG